VVDLGGSGLDPGILGFLCFFHLNSRVSYFLLNVTFYVNSVEFMSMPR